MRLTERVYAIGGGTLGLRLSSDYDCNVFVLDGGTEKVMIDAGSGIEPLRLLRNLESAGIPRGNLSRVLLTHAHADHAGGAGFWRQFGGIEVVAPARTADIVAAGDEVAASLTDAREAGVYPEWYRLSPCPIDCTLRPGETLCVGDLTLQPIAAPGHSSDMVCYYCPELFALFSADAVFAGGRLAVIATADFSLDAYRDTIESLASLRVEQLFPGHGEPVLRDGGAAITEANQRFREGLPLLSIV